MTGTMDNSFLIFKELVDTMEGDAMRSMFKVYNKLSMAAEENRIKNLQLTRELQERMDNLRIKDETANDILKRLKKEKEDLAQQVTNQLAKIQSLEDEKKELQRKLEIQTRTTDALTQQQRNLRRTWNKMKLEISGTDRIITYLNNLTRLAIACNGPVNT
jgi:chromosome segregation ATPase